MHGAKREAERERKIKNKRARELERKTETETESNDGRRRERERERTKDKPDLALPSRCRGAVVVCPGADHVGHDEPVGVRGLKDHTTNQFSNAQCAGGGVQDMASCVESGVDSLSLWSFTRCWRSPQR